MPTPARERRFTEGDSGQCSSKHGLVFSKKSNSDSHDDPDWIDRNLRRSRDSRAPTDTPRDKSKAFRKMICVVAGGQAGVFNSPTDPAATALGIERCLFARCQAHVAISSLPRTGSITLNPTRQRGPNHPRPRVIRPEALATQIPVPSLMEHPRDQRCEDLAHNAKRKPRFLFGLGFMDRNGQKSPCKGGGVRCGSTLPYEN
jgi:hypothetical protein